MLVGGEGESVGAGAGSDPAAARWPSSIDQRLMESAPKLETRRLLPSALTTGTGGADRRWDRYFRPRWSSGDSENGV